MSPDEFHNQSKNGIYLFASNQCGKCSEQKQKMVSIKYQIVDCDVDPEFIYKNYNVDMIPCVRVYDNNQVKYEKIFVMNDSEIIELKKYE